jgi:hypothetical protein
MGAKPMKSMVTWIRILHRLSLGSLLGFLSRLLPHRPSSFLFQSLRGHFHCPLPGLQVVLMKHDDSMTVPLQHVRLARTKRV